jgi:hypothetical protein
LKGVCLSRSDDGGSGLSDEAAARRGFILHPARRGDAIERFMLFTGRGCTAIVT